MEKGEAPLHGPENTGKPSRTQGRRLRHLEQKELTQQRALGGPCSAKEDICSFREAVVHFNTLKQCCQSPLAFYSISASGETPKHGHND